MELPPPCPWSSKKLRRLGEAIKAGRDVDENTPTYDEVIEWYSDLAASVASFLEEQDWEPLLGDTEVEIAARPKTRETLRDKLIREPNYPLHNIHDVAGVRFEARMRMDQQDAVVGAVMGFYEEQGLTPRKIDHRHAGGHSAYRAVHILLPFNPRGIVEVQVRTDLQGRWANCYEALADRLGRYIRYDELPDDPAGRRTVELVQDISLDQIKSLEEHEVDLRELEAQIQDSEIVRQVYRLQQELEDERDELRAALESLESKLRAGRR